MSGSSTNETGSGTEPQTGTTVPPKELSVGERYVGTLDPAVVRAVNEIRTNVGDTDMADTMARTHLANMYTDGESGVVNLVAGLGGQHMAAVLEGPVERDGGVPGLAREITNSVADHFVRKGFGAQIVTAYNMNAQAGLSGARVTEMGVEVTNAYKQATKELVAILADLTPEQIATMVPDREYEAFCKEANMPRNTLDKQTGSVQQGLVNLTSGEEARLSTDEARGRISGLRAHTEKLMSESTELRVPWLDNTKAAVGGVLNLGFAGTWREENFDTNAKYVVDTFGTNSKTEATKNWRTVQAVAVEVGARAHPDFADGDIDQLRDTVAKAFNVGRDAVDGVSNRVFEAK